MGELRNIDRSADGGLTLGAGVTTVEGLARVGVLIELQQAFVEKTALQCGVCILGFLVSATALLRQNANSTEEELRFRLQGNLCPYTGYVKIFEAVLDAARKAAENAPREPVSAISSEFGFFARRPDAVCWVTDERVNSISRSPSRRPNIVVVAGGWRSKRPVPDGGPSHEIPTRVAGCCDPDAC
jgi:xanthine dehydrogenase iron-sulfur cluster and FAD-binding subunit A